jgi:hypothetical protein
MNRRERRKRAKLDPLKVIDSTTGQVTHHGEQPTEWLVILLTEDDTAADPLSGNTPQRK